MSNPQANRKGSELMSYSEALGVVLGGRVWWPEADDADHVDVTLRVDDDDDQRPDLLDLRFSAKDGADLILNVSRVDLLRALGLLGAERDAAQER